MPRLVRRHQCLNSLIVAGSAVAGDQVLRRGNALLLVCDRVNADAICSVFGKTLEMRLGRQRGAQVFGLTDEDDFMGSPAAIGLVVVDAFGDEKNSAHGFEPRLEGPYVEVVFLPRLPGKGNASVCCDIRLRSRDARILILTALFRVSKQLPHKAEAGRMRLEKALATSAGGLYS